MVLHYFAFSTAAQYQQPQISWSEPVRLMALLLLLLPTVLLAADNTPALSLSLSIPLFSSPPPPRSRTAAKGFLLFKDTAELLLLAQTLQRERRFNSLLTVIVQRKVVLGIAEFLRAASDEDVVVAKEILEAGHLGSQDTHRK